MQLLVGIHCALRLEQSLFRRLVRAAVVVAGPLGPNQATARVSASAYNGDETHGCAASHLPQDPLTRPALHTYRPILILSSVLRSKSSTPCVRHYCTITSKLKEVSGPENSTQETARQRIVVQVDIPESQTV